MFLFFKFHIIDISLQKNEVFYGILKVLLYYIRNTCEKKPDRKCTKAEKNEGTCGNVIGKTLSEKAFFPPSFDIKGLEIKFTSDESLKCQNFI